MFVAGNVFKRLNYISWITGLLLTWNFEVLERGVYHSIFNVFQVVLRGKGKILLSGGRIGNVAWWFFYWVVKILQAVILTIRTVFTIKIKIL